MDWIYADVVSVSVMNVGMRLFHSLDQYGYEPECDSHITIVPGFSGVQVDIPNVQGVEVGVEGVGFYPSEREPMVIYLELDEDDLWWREEILSQVPDSHIKYDVAEPHVTMVKQGDDGDQKHLDFSRRQVSDVRAAVNRVEHKVPDSVTVKCIKRETWHT